MLTILGSGQRKLCDGMSRRAFLNVGALGIGGLTWANLLRSQARGEEKTPPRAKSVIMIYLYGGPSHLDMYDLKPDAPVEFRGEFKPIHTNVPGMDLCELMPLQARIADKLAVIRNLRFQQPSRGDDHTPPELFSGFPQEAFRPALGSVVSRLRADAGVRSDLPAYVLLSHRTGIPGAYSVQNLPAFLGSAHQPFTPVQQKNLSLAQELTLERLQERDVLLRTFDRLNRELDDRRGTLAGADSFNRQALAMLATGRVRDAFDLAKEPTKVRQRYSGATDFLLARRLVEAGVPVVSMAPTGSGLEGWDDHGNIFKRLRVALPALDRAIAALVTDLHERGLDKDVAVVIWGEMGRTPKVNGNAGRDHWKEAGFALLAGGGLTMGQAIGATSAKGERPAGKHYTPENVLATLYHVLGIDPSQTLNDFNGRPQYLLDNREPISELVS
jgi:hypothetical protein